MGNNKLPLPTGMVQVKAPVLVHRPIARDHFLMRLKAPAIARRLSIYRKKTSLLLKYYRQQGKLVVFDGERPIKKISQTIIAYLRKNAG